MILDVQITGGTRNIPMIHHFWGQNLVNALLSLFHLQIGMTAVYTLTAHLNPLYLLDPRALTGLKIFRSTLPNFKYW
jgi:hypothetical protein